MSNTTKRSIKWSTIFQTSGFFVQLLAVADFFNGPAIAWPHLMLLGVLLSNIGSAGFTLFCRRKNTK